MATDFPGTALDTFADKSGSDVVPSAGWNNIQDAIEAIEAKVGITNSAVENTLEHKLNDVTTAIAAITATAQPTFRISRLKFAVSDATHGTLQLYSIYNGDTCGSQAITTAGYDGTYYKSSASTTPGSVLTIKNAAITGTPTSVIGVVPNGIAETFCWADFTATVTSSNIVVTCGSYTSGPDAFAQINASTHKAICLDIIYYAS